MNTTMDDEQALGCITDLIGFISLLITMASFGESCYGNVKRDYGDNIDAEVWLGPGYCCCESSDLNAPFSLRSLNSLNWLHSL